MRRGIMGHDARTTAFGLTALITVGLLAGCDARSAAPPETAAEAGRSVIGAGETTPVSTDPAGPMVPEPISEKGSNETIASVVATPVVAAKPESLPAVAAGKPAPAKSPEAPADLNPRAMARVESGLSVGGSADPAKYPGGIIPASPNAEPLPGGPRLLVPERNFRTEGKPPALRVNYDDLDLLKVLNLGSPLPADVVEMLPEWLKKLDGKRIRIRGFMYPQYTTRLTGFVLTRDMGICCFGPNPKIYYLISVKLKEGTEIEYIPGRPFDVAGTFHINPINDGEGHWFQLWSIDNATVIE